MHQKRSRSWCSIPASRDSVRAVGNGPQKHGRRTWRQSSLTYLNIGITLTIPIEFRTILQPNSHLLHGVPAMGAEAIIQWAKARYGVRLLVLVVQQTFGGLLNFVPHLHVMVSAGGLQESTNRWIHFLKFDEEELMRAWRYAFIAFLAEACKRNILRSAPSSEELFNMFRTNHKRRWNVFISRRGSKTDRLKHDGRYVRRPPIAQHRLTRVGKHEVEYLAKDTRNKKFVLKRYSNEEFVNILMQHVPDRGRHAMRYFGLLSPRSKARLWAAIFALLGQQQHPHPPRSSWRWLSLKTFGTILSRIVSVVRCIGLAVEHRSERLDSGQLLACR